VKKKIAFPQNIRFQLPFSYAGIVLLAAVLIGAILVLIIDNYYQGLEQEYLAGNANGIARNLNGVLARLDLSQANPLQENARFLQNQARAAAFLIQARVRILDTAGGLVADSGAPSQAWYIHLPPGDESSTPRLDATPGGPPISYQPAQDLAAPARDLNPPGFPARRSMYGFSLQDASIEEGRRSTYKSQEPFFSPDGAPLGIVEVSEGPAYGRAILVNVIQGWGIASLIALLASAAVGWLVSLQITRPIIVLERAASEMQDGRLSARVPHLKPAEMDSLAVTFNRMAERIENDIKTLQRFVSDAAHELRTPLTALRADLDLAGREKDEQRVKNLVGRSLEQVTRLEQLSKDLLDLSKIETQAGPEAIGPVDLAQLVLKTCEGPASAAEQAGVDFVLELADETLNVGGYELHLQRALTNLLDNAVKFTPAGGKVTVFLTRQGDLAQITVEDTGIGIPPEERDLLFNRFHRGRNTSSYPGSGLGLAIARAIVDRHGGEIGLEPGATWTRFYIRLPLAGGKG
jgi:signal transduction histidine kinase